MEKTVVSWKFQHLHTIQYDLHLTLCLSVNNLMINSFPKNAVSFLADLGGLYCISIGIFFYMLVQVCFSSTLFLYTLLSFLPYQWTVHSLDSCCLNDACVKCALC